MSHTVTPLKVSIHPVGCSPVFGDRAVHVSLEDENHGPSIIIETLGDYARSVSLDLDELEAVLDAARKLIAMYPRDAAPLADLTPCPKCGDGGPLVSRKLKLLDESAAIMRAGTAPLFSSAGAQMPPGSRG